MLPAKKGQQMLAFFRSFINGGRVCEAPVV
jgi:hypothetical protein